MALRARILKPDQAYRNKHLLLPKSRMDNIGAIKAALSFDREGQSPLFAWEDLGTHLQVPREFIPVSRYPDLPFQVVDTNTHEFPTVHFSVKSQLRDAVQSLAFSSLIENGSQILSLACGKGKTVVALHAAAHMHMPALVIVNTEDLAHQWKTRILEHTDIKADDIGWIQADKWKWEGKPIVIAMIQTLCSKADEIPAEMLEYFGIVIYDEAHILGAPYFNQIVGLFDGIRWGLTATWQRADGMEKLYQYHLGDIAYEYLDHDVIPTVFFMRTGIELPKNEKERRSLNDRTGEMSISKVHSWLAEHRERNTIIMAQIDMALQDGRTILVLGERVDQLKMLHQHYPASGLIYSGVKGKTREGELQNKNPIFAIAQLAKQGLDRSTLDTIFLIHPFTDEGRFRQIMGRAQRKHPDKEDPYIIVFEDNHVPTHQRMCRKLRKHLNALKYPYELVDPVMS